MEDIFKRYPELWQARVLAADVVESHRPGDENQPSIAEKVVLRLYLAGLIKTDEPMVHL